jgi:L-threonylcarbamoyladenylate synthase
MAKVSLPELIAGAAAGKVISFPTDTVPALAVLPKYAKLLFAVKHRPPDKPLILMTANSAEVWSYVSGTADELEIWQKIAGKHWPGAVTLVLPAGDCVSPMMNPLDRSTIGIRVPDNAIAREILAQTGALATTSANLSGQPPLEMMGAIATTFPDVLVLDCDKLEIKGKIGSGIPSTVVKWSKHNWQILRQGSIVNGRFEV